jgi:hypothetical protein
MHTNDIEAGPGHVISQHLKVGQLGHRIRLYR